MIPLRWRFKYLTKPDYCGVWSYDDPARPAWKHAFDGIETAMIETRDEVGKVSVIAEVSGQDFQNFQWIAIAKPTVESIKLGKKLPAKIVGLQIQHRHGQIKCYIDGSIERNKRTYDTINFASYGR